MSVEIRPVASKRDLKAFIRFPVDLYRDEPRYVPVLFLDEYSTLRKDRNPAFEFCEAEYLLAYREGSIVGRIAAFLNRRYIEKWGRNHARFGWVDFIEDFEVAAALVGAAEDWARRKGCEAICGPLGFTDMDREGMLVEGFDEVATMATIWNRPYYPEYLGRLGYAKDADWIEFHLTCPTEIPEKVLRVEELISKRSGVRVYPWRTKRELVGKFGPQVFAILDEAYAKLYGTTPLSERQVKVYIDMYLGFVDPRFTKMLVDAGGKLIGFGISMPSLSAALVKSRGRLLPFGWIHLLHALKKPEGVDMYLVAIKPEYQARGVVALLMGDFNRSVIGSSVKWAESNPELETNIEVQQLWKDYERRQHKRRRVFIKAL